MLILSVDIRFGNRLKWERKGDVKKMNLNRKIFRLVIPAIVSNITVPLLGLSDTAIAGHLHADSFLAAMAAGSSMLNLSFWLFGFLRAGTTGLTANAVGENNITEISRLFCKSLFWALVIGFTLLLARKFIGGQILGFLNPPGEAVNSLAAQYYDICILAAPAQLATMAMSGWMIGMQSTFWPMVVAVATNVVNIPLSLFLVFGVPMGFTGLAVGTCLAQWLGCLAAVGCVIHIWKSHNKFDRVSQAFNIFGGFRKVFARSAGNFFSVNVWLFFRSWCIMAVLFGMTYFSSRLGEVPLAANAVMMQFFYFFSFFMDGFAYAAEALAGKLSGEGNWQELRDVTLRLVAFSAGVALFFFLAYMLFTPQITSLISDSSRVVSYVSGLRWAMALLPVLAVAAFLFDGFYIGLTHTGFILLATLISTIGYFAVNIACQNCFTSEILWGAFLGYLLLRGIILTLFYPHNIARRKDSNMI